MKKVDEMKKVDDPTRRSSYEYVNAMSTLNMLSLMVGIGIDQRATIDPTREARMFDGTTG